MTPKHKWQKKQKVELEFIKILTFYASKYIIKKVKTQTSEWEKIFANHVFVKGLISEYTEDIYNPTQLKKKKKPFSFHT